MEARDTYESESNGLSPVASFEELAEKVMADLFGRSGLSEVCGPISTGGAGNLADNIKIFTACINGLKRRGEDMIDQMPYEKDIWRLCTEWRQKGGIGYCMLTLEVVYKRIFESGKIKKVYFIPGYESSRGSCWEKDEAARLGIEIAYFSREEVRTFLEEEYPLEEAARLVSLLAA